MPVLHLLRHAKSSRDDPLLDDHDRPLASRGRKAAPAMARWMAENGLAPGLVLVSTARRTRETWALMQDAFAASRPEVLHEAALYLAPADEFLARLRRLPDDGREALLVGHNPGLHDLALMLAAGRGAEHAQLVEKFPTGALCSLESGGGSWRWLGDGRSRMIRFIRPSDISKN
jgi:phosphohistidine phosphatase